MDYKKIGHFITLERKAKKLTQQKLAEKLFVSEKTISKWENGNGLPDTTSLKKLSEVFEVSINEILNGERISSQEEFAIKAEEKILELQKVKEQADKRLFTMEIVIVSLCLTMLLTLILVSALIKMDSWIRFLLCGIGFTLVIVGACFALRIEQITGYYVCNKCGHKYVPTYLKVFFAPHVHTTRYMHCPLCKKSSWHKKVLK